MAKKTKAGLMKPLLMIVLVFGPALFLILISLNTCEHKFTKLPVYGELEDFEFTTVNGGKITPESQLDKITIYTTLQTSCPKECAIDMAKFNLLIYQHYRKYQRKMSHIKFVSIVTDENGNPVDNLEEMNYLLDDLVQGYDPEIWKLVSGDPKQIYDIENNSINIFEQESDEAFANKPYLETMMIVDKENKLRLIRRGGEEGLIRDLKEHIALLQKQYDKEAFNAKKEKE